MAKKLYEESNIYDIACAIREKCGGTDTYKTCDMPAAIRALSTGGGGGGNEDDILSRKIAGDYTNNTVTYLGQYAFYGCDSLTSVSCPNVISSSGSIFYYCNNLESVSLPALKTVQDSVFYNCPKLTTVDISSATSISTSAFFNVPLLKKLDLPTVVVIESNAIKAAALDTLILRHPSRVCTLRGESGISNTLIPTTGYIYVPAALIDSYKTDSVWSNFADRFRTIEDYPDICG